MVLFSFLLSIARAECASIGGGDSARTPIVVLANRAGATVSVKDAAGLPVKVEIATYVFPDPAATTVYVVTSGALRNGAVYTVDCGAVRAELRPVAK